MTHAPSAAAPASSWAPPRDAVAAYLARQRWSGARGGTLADVALRAVLPLDLAPPAALVVADARVGGAPVRYHLPLVLRPRRDSADAAGEAVWSEEQDGVRVEAVDAPGDAAFRAALLDAVAAGRRIEGNGITWTGEGSTAARALAALAPASRVGSAEQSNTSVIYGDAAILKLYRRIEPGVHPELEIARFLTRVGFAHAPALLGAAYVHDADGTAAAAILQAFVPGASDLWGHAVAAARAYVSAADDGASADPFASDAERLGRVARAMHDALAGDADDPAFAPVPATAADVERWRDETIAQTASARAAQRGAGDATRDDAVASALADAMPRAESLALALAARIGDDAGMTIRHHGDFHLGQVLRAADGALYVVDFEGEPARPLAERRARHSALRDVAGMLRSFAYAAAAASMEVGPDHRAAERAAGRADAWERAMRDRFLGGYLAADAGPARYLPRERAHADALIALFELEKLFYELRYELQNRPDWVPIPLRGLARLTGAASGRTST